MKGISPKSHEYEKTNHRNNPVRDFNTVSIAQSTQKQIIYGKNWMAVTGKPLAATTGAMITATCTMWDVLSWGGASNFEDDHGIGW